MLSESGVLVDAWIKYYELSEKRGSELADVKAFYWAFEEMNSLCRNSPLDALTTIQRVFATTENEFVLANLAAGPLETLLARHGTAIISDIEMLAKSDQKFRILLRGVWQNMIDDQTWARVLKATK
jgi:hypothetical protein